MQNESCHQVNPVLPPWAPIVADWHTAQLSELKILNFSLSACSIYWLTIPTLPHHKMSWWTWLGAYSRHCGYLSLITAFADSYIHFYLDLMASSDNISLLYHIANKGKTVRDSEHTYTEVRIFLVSCFLEIWPITKEFLHRMRARTIPNKSSRKSSFVAASKLSRESQITVGHSYSVA